MCCAAHQDILWFRRRALDNAFRTPQTTFSDGTFCETFLRRRARNTMSFWVDGGIIFYPFAQVQIAPIKCDMSVLIARVLSIPEPTSSDIVWWGTGLDSGMQRIKWSTCIFLFRCKDKANLFLFILCQQDSYMASEHVLARKKKNILFLFLKTLVFWW